MSLFLQTLIVMLFMKVCIFSGEPTYLKVVVRDVSFWGVAFLHQLGLLYQKCMFFHGKLCSIFNQRVDYRNLMKTFNKELVYGVDNTGQHFLIFFSNPKRMSSSFCSFFPADYEYLKHFFPVRRDPPKLMLNL